jgi:16S rRNA (guanine527-N7)-methyltransferase
MQGAADLGLVLLRQQQEKLFRLVDQLLEWNTHFNLTAIRDPRDVVTKHLLDSLSIRPFLAGKFIVDVGTGAGFPGLPLAVVDPERAFTLIEATGKKARFVEHAVADLRLGNVTVVNARVESWKAPRKFDTVVARALGSLADFIRFAGALCAPGGRLLAMKGRLPEEEIAAIPRAWRVSGAHPLTVPGLDAQRHVLVIERAADVARGSR